MNRIVDVAERGASIRLDTGNLSVRLPDGCVHDVPLRDVAALVLSERAVWFSAALLSELAESGVFTVFCDKRHAPVGILTPFAAKSDQTRVMQAQIGASLPVKKQLWQSIVRRKLSNQAAVLERGGHDGSRLRRLAAGVRSGDPDNCEGIGARAYWRVLDVFKARNRFAPDANRLFNYAYMVLHALAGRALCASGLHPAFGIHHANGRNPFCLASDLVEAFRIAADVAVLDWLGKKPATTEVTPQAKRHIVGAMMASRFRRGMKSFGIVDAISTGAVSLRDSIVAAENRLVIPAFIPELPACG